MAIPTLTLNDGHTIPQLGFGVWQVSNDDVVPAVRAALEAGYRHIDTAAGYGNEAGVGRAIRESGIPREELFVTTKLDNPDQPRARAALEDSLELLGLDYVDLYLIHWPVPGLDKRIEAWHAMEEARSEGLIRSIGVSNFWERFLTELLREGSVVPAVNQIEYHPTFQHRSLQALDAANGIATEAWSPLGMGSALEDDVVAGIARRLGRTPAQVIIHWHLQEGRIVIPKSVTPSRIVENIAVTDFELTDDDVAAIGALDTGTMLGWDPEDVRG